MVMGMGIGVGFSSPPPWTPLLLPGLALLVDPGDQSKQTAATQPTIPGAGWSGAAWAGSGLGPYTHTAGDTTDLANAILIVGNRYLITYTVSGRTAGTVTCKAGTTAGTARSADGTYTDELSCAGTTSQIFTPSSDFNGAVTVTAITNISLARIDSSGGSLGGYMAQTTADWQPWRSQTGIGGRGAFEVAPNVADGFVHSAAAASWRFLHDGSGATFFLAHRRTTSSGNYLLSTHNSATSEHGIAITRGGSATVRVTVANGTGAFANDLSSPVSAFAESVVNIVEVGISTAGGVDVLVNGGTAATAAAGAFSSSNPSFQLNWGRRPSGNSLENSYGHLIIVAGHLAPTHADRVRTRQWLAAYYGVTLP